MKFKQFSTHSARTISGYSLVEVAISLAIAGVAIIGSINGYILSATRAEWSAYSLAAHSMAIQRIEQARAAKWDPTASPAIDQVVGAGFPVGVDILDVPSSGTNIVYATNITTITTVSANPPLKMIRVDCIWPFRAHGVFTNTVTSYRTTDQ